MIWLAPLAPPPEVDGGPVGQVEEDEHHGEHAQEDQVSPGKTIRSISTLKENMAEKVLGVLQLKLHDPGLMSISLVQVNDIIAAEG